MQQACGKLQIRSAKGWLFLSATTLLRFFFRFHRPDKVHLKGRFFIDLAADFLHFKFRPGGNHHPHVIAADKRKAAAQHQMRALEIQACLLYTSDAADE